MTRFDPLFDPALFEDLGYQTTPEPQQSMSVERVNKLKKLRNLAEPKVSLGDLQLMLKLFSPKLTASYPLWGGTLEGAAKRDNYHIQYRKSF